MQETKIDATTNAIKTEIIIDLIGPIIDVSNIADYRDIPGVRYLSEDDIAGILTYRHPGGQGWKGDAILKRIKEVLNSKSRVRLIDKYIIELLCKAKPFSIIHIISSVPDIEIFEAARTLIVNYSRYLCNELMKDQTQVTYEPIAEEDFAQLKVQNQPQNLKEFLEQKCDIKSHLIVFDDDIDIDVLTGNDMLVKEWIRGSSDENYQMTFENVINRRNRISKIDSDVSKLVGDGILELNKYILDEGFRFYVFDSDIRKKIQITVEAIKTIVEREKSHDRPVCVFLAGAPGTGKSYFVEQFFAYLEADDYYPTASLSGIPESEFPSAVKEHINSVYDKRSNRDNKTHVAFLDEVDTKGGVLAFRLLMDAMTGDAIDSKGIRRDDKTKKLIWLFAGSAGLNREDFIASFYKDDKKVVDFFDRIHFDIALPTVEQPGQAILAFLSSLPIPKDERGVMRSEIKVTKAVLNLFGLTVWKGARQIKTICRVACSRGIDWDNIQLENFDGIGVSMDFISSLQSVRNLAEEEGSDLNKLVTIKIPISKP